MQEKRNKGLEYETKVYDNNRNLYSKSIQNWSSEERTLGSNSYYVIILNYVEDYLYDGDVDAITTKIEYWYDDYGNIVKTKYWGGGMIIGDERYLYNEYLYNTNESRITRCMR